jgi:hypothetical protein
MALSEEDRITVFTILGIPLVKPQDFDFDLTKRNMMPGLVPTPLFEYDPTFVYDYNDEAITELDKRIDALSTTELDRVESLVTEWNAIEAKTVIVKTDKISLSYEDMRSNIRRRLMIVLPLRFGGVAGSSKLSIG